MDKSSEAPQQKIDSFPFEKEIEEDKVVYKFNKVGVIIDSSGKNYQELPEIMFGVFKSEMKGNILGQPALRIEGVDMEYVANCVREAAQDMGKHEFWFHPYGDDTPLSKAKREAARTRLFERYFNISPEKTGYGYVLEV